MNEKQKNKEENCLNHVREVIQKQNIFCPYSRKDILKTINEAKLNPNGNDFPDFLSENGFIEHFEVSASSENRKGSVLKQENFRFDKDCEKQIQERKEQMPDSGGICSQTMSMREVEYSIEDFRESFRRHFMGHLESLKKYGEKKEVRAFLVEHTGATFRIRHNGKYVQRLYSPICDREILNFLYQHRDEVTHLIYTHAQNAEILETSTISLVIQQIPDGVTFEAGKFGNDNVILQISL